MSLKFKRNYPIVLLLVGILSLLALTLGDQPIASYAIHAQIVQAGSTNALRVDVYDDIACLIALPGAQASAAGLLAGDAVEANVNTLDWLTSYEN